MMPRRVEAVIFDMDGLLVDTEAWVRELMREASRRRGVELPDAVFLRMVGLPHAAGRAVAAEHFGPAFDIDAWDREIGELARAQETLSIAVKAGAVELLVALQALGIPRAVATSSGHAAVERQLGPSGLLSRFQAVVAHGDYARGKPFPDPFLLAARRLGVAPEHCLALEDSHNGVRAAHAAGMMTVMVPDLLEATEEMQALCVAVADTLHDVRDWVAAGAQPGVAAGLRVGKATGS